MVLHTQEAITREARVIVDGTKKKRHQKAKKLVRDAQPPLSDLLFTLSGQDELGTHDNLGPEALTALRGLAREFIGSCFNRMYLQFILVVC